MRIRHMKQKKGSISQVLIMLLSIFILFLTFIPIILMIILSLKSNVQIYGSFWSLPVPAQWDNYYNAFSVLLQNALNSIFLVSVATIATVLLASLCGYVFARLEFPGKDFLYLMILSLMMVPGILTLTPLYKLMEDLGLLNTWWAILIPWITNGQVFGILLCRTFLGAQPVELFESARLDGASELQAYYKIAIPLAKPILTTLGIMNMMGFYNDFIWPLIVIDSSSKQVMMVAVRAFQSSTGAIDVGGMVAGYVFATLPLLVLFLFGSRFYIEGVTSGAIKS